MDRESQSTQPLDYPSAEPAGSSTFNAVWICLGLGAITLFIFPRTLQWLGSITLGTHFDPFLMPDGTVVPYPKTDAFWSDLGPTTLGVMLIVEGLTYLAGGRRAVLLPALILVAVCTTYNLGYVAGNIRQSVPIVSLIAVVVGTPSTVDLYKRLRVPRAALANQNSA